MQDDYLCALALLKISYDQYGTTYLDYLTPFIGDTIRSMGSAEVSARELHDALERKYGLVVPESVLNTLMRRLVRRGYGRLANRQFYPNIAHLSGEYDFDNRRQEINEQLAALCDAFIGFVSQELGRELSQTEAASVLIKYADDNGLPMIRHAQGQQTLKLSLSPNETEYITSRFIVHVFENESSEMDTLLILAKGSKLASVLYLPNPEDTQRRIRRLTAVLDTPTLLSALGHQGERQQAAAREMLSLARKCQVDLSVLEDTRSEVESVLHAVASKIARYGYSERSVRGVEAHFLAKGFDASDIQLIIGRLDKALAALGVQSIERPDMTVALSVDESSLEAIIQESVGYHRSDGRLHDLNALTATYRLRAGRMPTTFEDCRAVFITPNTALARASRDFFEEGYGNLWPIAITEDDFTTLLWLRQSLDAPDLPRQRLLADAYAALEPGPVWTVFLQEIEKLRAQNELSEDDYVFFRYSLDAKKALMRETLGEASRMTSSVVHKIVERARDQHRETIEQDVRVSSTESHESAMRRQRDLESKLAAARAEREDALHAMREARAANQALIEQQRSVAGSRARSHAKVVRIALMFAVGGLLALGLWMSAPPDWIWQPSTVSALPRWTIGVAVAGLVVASAGNLLFGSYLSRSAKKLEGWISVRLATRYVRKLGLDEGARHLGPF